MCGDAMAKMSIKSNAFDKYTKALEQMADKSGEICKRSLYPGAGIIADAIREGIDEIPVLSPGHMHGTPEDPIDGVTSVQKEGLKDGFGLTKFDIDGETLNIKAGWTGYNRSESTTARKAGWTTTKQANAMIARSVESGTSFRKKHPFIKPAVRKNKKKCIQAIQDEFDKQLKDFNLIID